MIRGVEIIGEATKQIPKSIRNKYPEVPWRDMAGMRDKVIYQYFGVDLKVVWKTATHYLPEIKPWMEKVLKDIENEARK